MNSDMIYSAGIIPFYKANDGNVMFFVGHPGGNHPYMKYPWLYLKGGVEGDEKWQDAAIREFQEETGIKLTEQEKLNLIPLGSMPQNSHKIAVAFGLHKSDIDPDKCTSNLVEGESYPEIDEYRWMTYKDIKACTHPAHCGFYDQLYEMVTED